MVAFLRLKRLCVGLIFAACGLGGFSEALADVPTVKLATASGVSPSTAWTAYGSATTHTNGSLYFAATPPEIKAMARTLGAGRLTNDQYTTNVFQYVAQNVAIEFHFGLAKGARGALIDQSGTAFDQAELMVKLLREGGVAASYQLGTITLTASDFSHWSGLASSASTPTDKAICQFLADAGFPATVGGSTTCSSMSGSGGSVVVAHVWVTANGKYYDPAFKVRAISAGIDMAAGVGCGTASSPTCGSTMSDLIVVGATTGTVGSASAPFVQDFNEAGISAQLDTYATSLQAAVEANEPAASVEDLVGGASSSIGGGSAYSLSAPYNNGVAQYTWSGEIPDQYRTTLRVQYQEIDQTVYADEAASRRLRIYLDHTASTIFTRKLYGDDILLQSSTCATCTTSSTPESTLTLTANRPYVASTGAYGDEVVVLQVSNASGPITLIQAWGNVTKAAVRYAIDIQKADPSPFKGGSSGYSGTGSAFDWSSCANPATAVPTCRRDDQPTLSTLTMAQKNRVARLIGGIDSAQIITHSTLGAAYTVNTNSGLPIMAISSQTLLSIQAGDAGIAKRSAAFNATALAYSVIDGSVGQQNNNGVEATSSITNFVLANRAHIKMINITSANWSSTLGSLTNYSTRTSKLGSLATAGYDFILPQDGQTPTYSGGLTTGGSDLVYQSDRIGYLVMESWNASAGAAGIDPGGGALRTASFIFSGKNRPVGGGVNAAEGDVTFAPAPDLVAGDGSLPFSNLAFQRYYNSGFGADEVPGDIVGAAPAGWRYYGPDEDDGAHLGGGWTHSFQIGARLGSDGLRSLGSDNGLDATAAIAALYVLNDLAKVPSFNSRLASVVTGYWLGKQLIGHTVAVRIAPSVQVFQKLPNGRFNGGPSQPNTLTQTGALGSVTTDYQGQTHTDYGAIGLTFTDAKGRTISFNSGSSTGWFDGTSSQLVGDPLFKGTKITWPNGFQQILSYGTYSATGTSGAANYTKSYLTGVSNSFGRSLTFTSVQTGILNGTGGLSLEIGRKITQITDENGRHIDFALSNCPVFYSNNGAGTGSSISNWTSAAINCNTLTVTAPDSKVTTYGYASGADSPDPSAIIRPSYRLRRVYTPSNTLTPAVVVAYDDLFRAKTSTDMLGRITGYYAGGIGEEFSKRAEVIDPIGNTTILGADYNDTTTYITNALGKTLTYGLNYKSLSGVTQPEANGLSSTTDSRGNTLTVSRFPKDGTSLLLAETITYGESPTSLSCSSPKTCNLPVTITDSQLNTITYTYDPSTGDPTRVVSPADADGTNGQTDLGYTAFTIGGVSVSLPTSVTTKVASGQSVVTTYSYDPLNHYVLASFTRDAGSSPHLSLTTNFTHDAVGNVTVVDGPRTDVDDTANYIYDVARRLTFSIGADPDGAGSLARPAIKISYDAEGAATRTDVGTTTNNTASDFTTLFHNTLTLDAAGRVVALASPLSLVAMSYDADDRTVCSALRMNPSTYSAPPTDACSATSLGGYGGDRIVKNAYDAIGSVTQIVTGYGSPSQASVLTATYSANGRLLSSQDGANNKTSYAYDGYDRILTVSSPTTAQGTGTSAEVTASYTYDNLDQITGYTHANTSTSYTYDGLGRVIRKTLSGTSPTDYYYSYNLTGHLLYSHLGSAAGSGVDYTYDVLGRRLSESAAGRTIGYSYDGSGNRTRVTWPDGLYVDYSYDAQGHVTQLRENGATSGLGVLVTYAYDALGRRTNISRGNGASTNLTYSSSTGELTTLSHDFSGTANDVTFSYTDRSPSGQTVGKSTSNSSYVFRPVGINQTYTLNGLNQYTFASGAPARGFAYDAANDLASDGVRSFTYDPEGRLLTASAPTALALAYDTLGRLQSSTSGSATTTFLYSGTQLVGEYDSSGVLVRRYVFGATVDEPAVWYEGAGTASRRWLHADNQNSIVAYSDASGAASAIYAYGPGGEPNSWSGVRFRYTGQIMLPEAQLYHFRARVYDPAIGRFLQPDPSGPTDGLNLYSYAENDSVNFIDPTGLTGLPNSDGSGSGSDVVVTAAYDPCFVCQSIVRGSYPRGFSPERPGGDPVSSANGECTAARNYAARVGAMLDKLNQKLQAATVASGAATFFAGLLEIPTAGADTPITAAGAAATGFFEAGTIVTGAAAAAFKSYAAGNPAPAMKEALIDLVNLKNSGILHALNKVPGGEHLADAISGVGEAAANAEIKVEEACGHE